MKIMNYINRVLIGIMLMMPTLHAGESARTRQLGLMGFGGGTPSVSKEPTPTFVPSYSEEEKPKTSWWGYMKSVPGATLGLVTSALTLYGLWLQFQIKEQETYQAGFGVASQALNKWQPGTQPQGQRKETTFMGQRKAPQVPKYPATAEEAARTRTATEKTVQEFEEFQKQPKTPELTPEKYNMKQQAQAQERARRINQQTTNVQQRAQAADLTEDEFEKFIQAQSEFNTSVKAMVKEFEIYQLQAPDLSVDQFFAYLRELKKWEQQVVNKYRRQLPVKEILQFTALEKADSSMDAEDMIQRFIASRKLNPRLTVKEFMQQELIKRRAQGIMGHITSAKL